jgi:PP-loop superfamily ATP-utilizing enzyme
MDIVERLRKIAEIHFSETGDWCEEAADEIEKLREERNRLREALRKIGEGNVCVSLLTHPSQCGRAYQARTALKEKE